MLVLTIRTIQASLGRVAHDTRAPHSGGPRRGAVAQWRQRDGRGDPCPRLGTDAARPDHLLVTKPPHDGAFSARQPLSVTPVVGSPVRLDLQRCLPPGARHEAPVGAGATGPHVLERDLACAAAADRYPLPRWAVNLDGGPRSRNQPVR